MNVPNLNVLNNEPLAFPYALALASLVLYLMQSLLFGDEVQIGHDYGYFLPYLLGGHYWFLNNGLSAPWFTPALCAGIPHFANPQSAYYAIPQLLLIFVGPLASVKVTYFLFGLLGFAGAYKLARHLSEHTLVAVFVGFAFVLNGFVLSRVQVGHFSFHAYLLLPLICYLLLKPNLQQTTINRFLSLIVSGALLAYFIQAGAAVIVVPIGISLLLTLYQLKSNNQVWLRLIIAGTFGLLLCASKLVASWYFMQEFPRELYYLPGYDGFFTAVVATLRSLVWPMSMLDANAVIVNKSFLISIEELDYSLSIAFIICLGTIYFYKQFQWLPSKILIVCLVLCMPLAVNTYQADWNNLLKSLPYFGTTTTLFRWNLIYILPLLLLSGKVLHHVIERWQSRGQILAGIAIVATIIVPIAGPYKDMPRYYDPSLINAAYWQTRESGVIPVILNLEESTVGGKRSIAINSGDSLTRGASQIVCNEPLFGYWLENFRFEQVFAGGTFAQREGRFNFYRPECMVFPDENQCSKGERYSLAQVDELTRLVTWQAVAFQKPKIQVMAGYINGFALLILAVGFILQLGIVFNRRFRRKNSSSLVSARNQALDQDRDES